MSAGLAAPTFDHLARAWSLDPALIAALASSGVAYVAAASRLPRWPATRTAAFLAGLAVLVVALQSGIDPYAERLLSIHMTQHLLLSLAAAPLLVLGAPVSLALRTLHGRRRARLAAGLRSHPMRTLGHPAFAVGAFAAVTALAHLTPFYEAARRSPGLHVLEHLGFLATGVLLWLAVLGTEPLPRRAGPVGRTAMLLLAMVPMGLVGAWLASASEVRYRSYLAPARAWGRSALGDQQLAGALMWVGGALPLGAAMVLLAWWGLRREHARALAREAAEARRARVAPG